MHRFFPHLELLSANVLNKLWTLTFFTEPEVCYLHKTLCVKQQVVQF